jgi:endonuclease/exonuclease/phosphatase family metal-dependent hydrolase
MFSRNFYVVVVMFLVGYGCKTASPEKKVLTPVTPMGAIDLVDPKTKVIDLLSPGYFETLRFAFYNLENLFDTIDGPNDDEEYLPTSAIKWNTEKYQNKLKNMARVIDSIRPHILGVCEVENRHVLIDLKTHSQWLSEHHAEIVHQESPDKRGIDVALFFTPEWSFYATSGVSSTENIEGTKGNIPYQGIVLEVPTGNPDKPTRNILAAEFTRNGVPFTVFINHWPSRSGGEEKTRGLRFNAAQVLKNYIVSRPQLTQWIAMGDFNDNPEDSSLRFILDVGHPQQLGVNLAYELRQANPDLGTGLYKDRWDMFDQIIISKSLYHLGPNAPIPSLEIYKRDWLLQHEGTFKGHPFRTFGGKTYLNGYSDHLPVWADLYLLMP